MKTKKQFNELLESSQRNVSPLQNADPVGVEKLPVVLGGAGTADHSARAHSKVSPSKLKNLELCAGWIEDPHRETHPITEQGTKCHEALDSGDWSGLTEEERVWVKMCADYVKDVATTYNMPPDTFKELELNILPGMWGFADLVLAGATNADLVDFKFGLAAQTPVDANPAAQAYVYGIFQKWPGLYEIKVHYLYPRRDEADTHTYTRKDVPNIRLRLETIVARVKECDESRLYDAAKRNPVPDNCLYCGRKATCTALHRYVLPLATRYAGRHDISLVQPDFSAITSPEDWSRLLPYAPVLEQMADSLKRHALAFRQESGKEIPGFELRSRQGKKKILNAELAYGVAKDYVTHEEFMRCVDVSAKQLADAVAEKAPRGQKSRVTGELEGKLRDAGALENGAESFFLARSKG